MSGTHRKRSPARLQRHQDPMGGGEGNDAIAAASRALAAEQQWALLPVKRRLIATFLARTCFAADFTEPNAAGVPAAETQGTTGPADTGSGRTAQRAGRRQRGP